MGIAGCIGNVLQTCGGGTPPPSGTKIGVWSGTEFTLPGGFMLSLSAGAMINLNYVDDNGDDMAAALLALDGQVVTVVQTGGETMVFDVAQMVDGSPDPFVVLLSNPDGTVPFPANAELPLTVYGPPPDTDTGTYDITITPNPMSIAGGGPFSFTVHTDATPWFTEANIVLWVGTVPLLLNPPDASGGDYLVTNIWPDDFAGASGAQATHVEQTDPNDGVSIVASRTISWTLTT